MNIATFLTFIRIFVSPIFLLIYIKHDLLGISDFALPFVLLFLLAASELSDIFDGFFARRYNQVTDFGKIFDPMADSIYRLSVFLTFTLPPVNLPMPIVFLFFYRDSVITTLRTVCALKGYALAARTSGKLKAIFQGNAAGIIVLLMIAQVMGHITSDELVYYSALISGIVGIYTILSGIDYIVANISYVKKVLFIQK